MGERGRKTPEKKLDQLKVHLEKKTAQRAAMDEEIKVIRSQIQEIEHAILIKETNKLKATLSKKGMTLEELTEAVEAGNFQLDKLNENQ